MKQGCVAGAKRRVTVAGRLAKHAADVGKLTLLLCSRIIHVFSDTTAYSKSLHEYEPHAIHLERQKLMRASMNAELRSVFGTAFSLDDFDTGNKSVFSIVDHHDALNHPSFILSNISANLFKFMSPREAAMVEAAAMAKPRAIITISDSGVPTDHFGNKRGMRFDGHIYKIFPYAKRHEIIFGVPVIEQIGFARQASAAMPEKIRIKARTTTRGSLSFLEKFDAMFNSQISQFPHASYARQVTAANRKIWKELFDKKIQDSAPELFHVHGEGLAMSMLETYFKDPTHPIYRVCFEKPVRDKAIRLFSGIKGCWGSGTENAHDSIDALRDDSSGAIRASKKHGTHLFWAVNSKRESQRLWIRDDKLQSPKPTSEEDKAYDAPKNTNSNSGDISIELSPASLLSHMKNDSMYPGLFMVYGVLVFHCGIKPLTGGMSDVYIQEMKEKWIELLDFMSEPGERELVAKIPVKNCVQNLHKNLYAMDIMFQGGMGAKDLREIEVRRRDAAFMQNIKHKTGLNAVLFGKAKKLSDAEQDSDDDGIIKAAWRCSMRL